MSCHHCNDQWSQLGALWEKKTCIECKLAFCSRCAPKSNEGSSDKTHFFGNSKISPRSRSPRLCLSCKTLTSLHPCEADLMQIKVKDLQSYLQKIGVLTGNCLEKKDLVDLVLSNKEKQHLTETTFTQNYANSTHRQEFFESLDASERAAQNVNETSGNTGSANITIEPESPTTSTKIKQTSPNVDNIRVKLEEIQSSNDISRLNVRQLKYLLATNRVDFTGVLDKKELVELANRLWEQKQKDDSNKDNLPDSELCKICMDKAIDCLILECGHMATCLGCVKPLSECPICRKYIVRLVRVYKS